MSIFVFNCSRRISFSENERKKITGFFEELLLEHGGAYTLFGSKPVTMESLLELANEDLQKIKDFLQQHPEIETFEVERQLEEGWDVWKKKAQPHRFILKEIDLNGSRMLVFMNEKATVDILLRYYDDFRQIAGKDFDAQKEVAAFKRGSTEFWRKLLLDHKAKGILFGYGYQNASKFCSQCGDGYPSENNDPRLKAESTLDSKPFRIPIFAIIDEAEGRQLVDIYKKEREQIKSIYAGRDFLTVTLNQLYAK